MLMHGREASGGRGGSAPPDPRNIVLADDVVAWRREAIWGVRGDIVPPVAGGTLKASQRHRLGAWRL